MPDTALLRTDGPRVVNAAGEPVRLRGVGLGGWMNMENFITGYPATEALMREAVRGAIGEKRAELFFERLLTAFFDAADAEFLASLGVNCVRIPINYRHFESDDEPMRAVAISRASPACSGSIELSERRTTGRVGYITSRNALSVSVKVLLPSRIVPATRGSIVGRLFLEAPVAE